MRTCTNTCRSPPAPHLHLCALHACSSALYCVLQATKLLQGRLASSNPSGQQPQQQHHQHQHQQLHAHPQPQQQPAPGSISGGGSRARQLQVPTMGPRQQQVRAGSNPKEANDHVTEQVMLKIQPFPPTYLACSFYAWLCHHITHLYHAPCQLQSLLTIHPIRADGAACRHSLSHTQTPSGAQAGCRRHLKTAS